VSARAGSTTEFLGSRPDPVSAGFDPAALAAIDQAWLEMIGRGRLPGAVTLIARRGRLAAFSALGLQDPATRAPMRRDSLFRIQSMTKPVTSVAAMRLVEEGRMRLAQPITDWLPEFASTPVLVARGGGFDERAPRRPPTVQDLLRHTAGFTYEFFEASPVQRRYAELALGALGRTNADRVRLLATVPFMHEPGSVFDYSRATDVAGRLVEVVADEPLGAHLARTLFAPLGMADTGFHVPAAAHDRIAEPFAADPDSGGPVSMHDLRRPPVLESGGGGLVSSAADYARFLQMLLGGGTLDGVRILGRKTVEHMTSDHLGVIPVAGDMLPPGHGFGLGVAVRLATGLSTLPGSPGTYGWGGIGGTLFFVDPAEQLLAILMVQAPMQRIELQERFRSMVYAALA
jgi:CubicO group peptidase (beta-lactamase class C family)